MSLSRLGESALRGRSRRIAPPIPVQGAGVGNNSTNFREIYLQENPVQGNTIFVTSGIENNNSISSISQTNVTWSKIAETVSGQPHSEIWMGIVGASPSNYIAITYSGSSYGAAAAMEFRDVKGIVKQSSENSGTHSMPSLTPKSKRSLFIFVVCQDSYGAYYGEFVGYYMHQFPDYPGDVGNGTTIGAYWGTPGGGTPSGYGSRLNGNGGTVRGIAIEVI